MLTGKRALTMAIFTLLSVCLSSLSGVHNHTEVRVLNCFLIFYIFCHVSQTSLPLPVLFSQSSLLIHFCHYFLHIAVSNALCDCCSLVFTYNYFWHMLCNLVKLTSWTIWGSLLFRLHLSSDSISHLLPSPIFLHFMTFKRDLRVCSTTSWTENTVAV